jgi:hypothetical protein
MIDETLKKTACLKLSALEIPWVFLNSSHVVPSRDHYMAWNLSGKMVENCNCNLLCPCWFGVKEYMIFDKEYCASLYLYRIQNGSSNGQDLRGRDVVLTFDWPGPTIFDGNGTARLYIDDGAQANEHKELDDIFHGRKGGFMQKVAQLVSKWLPTQSAKIEISDDGRTLTAAVGKFGQIKSEQMQNNETGQMMTMQGSGYASNLRLENETFTVATSTSQWSDPDMPHQQLSTNSGAVAKFSWKGN